MCRHVSFRFFDDANHWIGHHFLDLCWLFAQNVCRQRAQESFMVLAFLRLHRPGGNVTGIVRWFTLLFAQVV